MRLISEDNTLIVTTSVGLFCFIAVIQLSCLHSRQINILDLSGILEFTFRRK